MNRPMVYAALAALAFATPAVAEPLRLAQQQFEPGAVPPYEVLTIVRSAGLDPLGQPFRRGPNYVLRAIGGDDQEVRVIVNARTGDILRVVPIATASRMPPGGVTMGPYERMDAPPPGYIAPTRRGYVAAPHDVDEDGYPPEADAPRPPEGVPDAPPRAGTAPPRGSNISRQELPPPSEPRVITATESRAPGQGSDGVLPPPPERFPQRALPPAVKPKPIKRAAAAPPKLAPLPKPRPAIAAAPSAPAATETPPPAPQHAPVDATAVPN